jgi:hypothetical protein
MLTQEKTSQRSEAAPVLAAGVYCEAGGGGEA